MFGMWRIQDADLSSMLRKLSVLSTAQAIKLAHSCIWYRTQFKICFAGTCKSNLIPLLPLRGAIYYRKNLFPWGDIYCEKHLFLSAGESLVKSLQFIIHDEVLAPCTRRGRSMVAPHSTRRRMSLALGNHVTRPFLLEEVDIVSLTCIYVCFAKQTPPCPWGS